MTQPSTVERPPTAPQSQSASNMVGVMHMLLSVLLFSFMDSTVKWLGDGYPVHQIVFFRCFVALGPIMFFVYQAGGLKMLKTKRAHVHLGRAVVGMSAMFTAFYAFSQMRLADAIAIMFSAPLFMTAFSVPFLKEKVGIRRWTAVFVGFIGVLIIVKPGGDVVSIGAISALAASVLMALAMIFVRHLSSTDHVVSITFYFTVTGAVISGIAVAFFGWKTPSGFDLMLFIAVGLLGGFAQYFMTSAFRHAEIGVVAPLEYTSIIWGSLIAFVIWSEIPVARVWTGAAIIIASGLYMLHREAQLAGMRTLRLPKLRTRG